MKGVICYYSTTGNTKLACRYIAENIRDIDFELYDIKTNSNQSFSSYDVIGFATFTDWWDIPLAFKKFIDNIPDYPQKYAFIFNTYAQLSGKTLKTMAELVRGKGFKIISSYSLRTPGNYPPSLARGRSFSDAPTQRELEGFKKFISELISNIGNLLNGSEIIEPKIKIGIFNSILRRYPRTQSKQQMGELYVDTELCIKCGNCKGHCAYGAIALNPFPVFDNTMCCACWACFNNCPQRAIYTKDLKGIGHYPGPSKKFREKLGYFNEFI